MMRLETYAGHPNIIARHARIVAPFPYPSLLNMAGANRGKPKPAIDRRHDVAASAMIKIMCNWNVQRNYMENSVVPEAACNVKASIT